MVREIRPPAAKGDGGSPIISPNEQVGRNFLRQMDQQRAAPITRPGETAPEQMARLEEVQDASDRDRVHQPLGGYGLGANEQRGQRLEIMHISPTEQVVLTPGTERLTELTHLQGQNSYGDRGTCGIVSCETLIHWFRPELHRRVTEDSLLRWANGRDLVSANGATTFEDQKGILGRHGVPVRIDCRATVVQLTQFVEEGRGVIIAVNSGKLWDEPAHFQDGRINHVVVVVGVARDVQSGQVRGLIINDSGRGDAGRFIEIDKMQEAFVNVRSEIVMRGTSDQFMPGVALVTENRQPRS